MNVVVLFMLPMDNGRDTHVTAAAAGVIRGGQRIIAVDLRGGARVALRVVR